jgi:hypothetical protein
MPSGRCAHASITVTPTATPLRTIVFILLAGITTVTLTQSGCGGMGQLNRSSARRMIDESERFKAPITTALKEDREFKIFPDSPDEPKQSVRERVLRMRLESDLVAAVLRQLGYVEVNVSVVEPPRLMVKGASDRTPWVLNITPVLTEKGKKLAESYGLSGGTEVPLARRELVEVTGISEKDVQAAADFTWKTVPSEAGEAFDPSSNTFKSLPQELQAALKKGRGIGPFNRAATRDWSQVYKATASFQKYDDGWRLTAISGLQ